MFVRGRTRLLNLLDCRSLTQVTAIAGGTTNSRSEKPMMGSQGQIWA